MMLTALAGKQDRLDWCCMSGSFAIVDAVEGDPLRAMEALFGGVRWVMKDGKVVVDKRR